MAHEPPIKVTRAVRAYMRAIAAKGGRQRSEAKTLAVRENAKRPRPNRRKRSVEKE